MVLEKRYGRCSARLRQDVQAFNISKALSETLHAERGSPALKITRRYLDSTDEAFEISVSIIRPTGSPFRCRWIARKNEEPIENALRAAAHGRSRRTLARLAGSCCSSSARALHAESAGSPPAIRLEGQELVTGDGQGSSRANSGLPDTRTG